MPFWIHLRSIKKLRLLRKIMAQAAVDLANLPSSHRRTSHASRKRKYTDEESTLDEDPAWQPSDIKPKRKRRSRADQAENNHHHSPQSPVHQSLHSRVSPPMGISVELTKTSDDMWENFRKIGTEMIICKEGRRMFPAIEINIKGLQPEYIYSVFITVQLRDQFRYRYNTKTGWTRINTGARPDIPHRLVPHADSRNAGSHFMSKPLSFKTIKMTNNLNTKRDNQLILLSMRSYVPQITIHCHTTEEDFVDTLSTCDFIAVTSYQRMEVTRLKIDTNQFAAAFRKCNKTPPQENTERSEDAANPPQQDSDSAISGSSCATSNELTFCDKQSRSIAVSSNSESNSSRPRQEHTVSGEPTALPNNTKGVRNVHNPTAMRSDQVSSTNLSVEEEEFPSCPTSPTPYFTGDNDDSEDDVDMSPLCVDNFSDEPVHIRPFIFQPQYHCGLTNNPYSTNLWPLKSSSHPQPPSSVVADEHRLWSSVAMSSTESTVNTGADSECFSLGLISDFLSL